jgi:plasmid replication initiation protein
MSVAVNMDASKHHAYQSIQAIRNYKVVKSNTLIQNSIYELSAQEQKIIMYLISKVKPDDEEFVAVEFDIIEFCSVCAIDTMAGKNRKDILDAIKIIADKSIEVKLDKISEKVLQWLKEPHVDDITGAMKVKLDDVLKPFLLKLENNFTQFELVNILSMKSKYSIRLYEILKSYEYLKTASFDIDELKILLSATNYNTYKNFRVFAIDIAVKEINTLTDLKVSYEAIKRGRKFISVIFSIGLKCDFDERFETWLKLRDAIG